jgi:hypothetical protein
LVDKFYDKIMDYCIDYYNPFPIYRNHIFKWVGVEEGITLNATLDSNVVADKQGQFNKWTDISFSKTNIQKKHLF